MKVIAAILAAGRGERFGGDKVLADLGGRPVWRWSFDTYLKHPRIDGVGLVGSPANLDLLSSEQAAYRIEGGANRQESSRLAVESADADIVLLHDAARPFVSPEVIDRVLDAILRTGAAAPGVAVPDTLRISGPAGYEVVDRSRVSAMQTPQGGYRDLLLRAHAAQAGILHTDEMALVSALAAPFEIVKGDPVNFKITTAEDLQRARARIGDVEIRTGIGYDIHAFSSDPSRPLVLGGVVFEGHIGLEGHSDADVVLHASVDALLGAAALGDIGQHFLNTDPRWHNEPSLTFLRHAGGLLAEGSWKIVNLDITMIGEKPKVMGRALDIRTTIATALGIDADRISFKATTNEGLGSLGRGEGIAAYAIASIRRA